jgi:uncharacterized membrane-anchored protein
MRKTVLIWGAVALQLLVLLFMIVEREQVIHFGKTVYLRTRPVDPIDPFRGQYVRLSYDFNRIPSNACRDGLLAILTSATNYQQRAEWKDHRIYAVFSSTPDGFLDFQYATDLPPGTGIYLRGRIDQASPAHLQARFGVEAFFVQQGQGQVIEAQRSRADRIRIPLNMEAALGPNGIAVLKGYQWAPLGLGITITATNAQRRPTALTLAFLNNSSKPLAILDQGNGHPCRLVSQQQDWGNSLNSARWVGEIQPRVHPSIRDEEVILLQPQASHTVKVDLLNPEWYVVAGTNPPQSLANLNLPAGFRFEYDFSPTSPVPPVKNANALWRGKLISSAFWGWSVD